MSSVVQIAGLAPRPIHQCGTGDRTQEIISDGPRSRAPRCGVSGPNCPLEDDPPPPLRLHCAGATALPPHPLPLPPTPRLFLRCSGRGRPGWHGGGVLGAGGPGRGPSKRHSGPDPHLGALNNRGKVKGVAILVAWDGTPSKSVMR